MDLPPVLAGKRRQPEWSAIIPYKENEWLGGYYTIIVL